jgi:hypothetical protein
MSIFKHVSDQTYVNAAIRLQEQNPGMDGMDALHQTAELVHKREERIETGERRHGRKQR